MYEMRCLRRAMHVTIRDRLRNDDIRESVGAILCVDYKERQWIRCFSHLLRMEPAKLLLSSYNCRVTSYSAQERPRNRWIENINTWWHRFTITHPTHCSSQHFMSMSKQVEGTKQFFYWYDSEWTRQRKTVPLLV